MVMPNVVIAIIIIILFIVLGLIGWLIWFINQRFSDAILRGAKSSSSDEESGGSELADP